MCAHLGMNPMSDESVLIVLPTVSQLRDARERLRAPSELDEALVATGIDALFVLLDGGTVEIGGAVYRLVRTVDDE